MRPSRPALLACAATVGALLTAGASPAGANALAAPATYVSVAPSRILDSRAGIGAPRGAVGAGHVVSVPILGHAGVPSAGVSSVVVNVTVTGGAGSGFVTVYPGAASRPATSSLNFTRGSTVANAVVALVGADGAISLYVGGSSTQLIADVTGYYSTDGPTAAGAMQPVSPARILDTRSGKGAPAGIVAAGRTVALKVTGVDSVPSGVSAVLLNVTATGTSGSGYVTVFPGGSPRPGTSSLDFPLGRTVANGVIAPVGPGGIVDLYVGGSATHLIADISGFYLAGTPMARGATEFVSPQRLLDTRTGAGAPRGAVAPGHVVALRVAGHGGVPAAGVAAALLNVTVTGGSGSGFVTVYAGGSSRPGTSSVGFARAQTVANGVIAPIGRDGIVDLYVGGSSTHLVADVSGYVRNSNSAWELDDQADPTVGHPQSVTCVSPGHCVAGDRSGHVVTLDGSSWSAPAPVGDATAILGVGCTSVTSCAVLTEGGAVSTGSGSAWSEPMQLFNTSSLAGGALSCVAATDFCMAVGNWASSVFTAGAWSPPASAEPVSGGHLSGVSCAATAQCVAVDTDGKAITYTSGGWSQPVQIFPATGSNDFASVSCASASSCVAARGRETATYDGHAWSSAQTVVPPGDVLTSISCTTTCRASGTAGEISGSGSSWTQPAPIAGLSGATYVSCPSESFCAALDDDGMGALRSASTWSTAVAADPASGFLTAVSCPTETSCAAVDANGSAVHYDGFVWSRAVQVVAGATFTAVSCPTVRFCVAVGSAYVDGSYVGVAARSVDGGWARTAVQADALRDVSCASATSCAAIDDSGSVVRWDGTQWSAPVDVFRASPRGSQLAIGISCPSATFCVAANSAAYAWRWDGAAWSGPVATMSGSVSALSCASTTSCTMLGRGRGRAVWDGAAWSYLSDPDTRNPTSLSCRSATFCAAAGSLGPAFFDGYRWQQVDEPAAPPADFSTDPLAVSCPTTTFCMVVGGAYGRPWTR